MDLSRCEENFGSCQHGDIRLSRRALAIGKALSEKVGQGLSMVFESAKELKRAYEYFSHAKTSFERVIGPHRGLTAQQVSEQSVVLSVGDTTYLDYRGIRKKREGYGPQGNGGNGLLLHSALAVDPQKGQPLGLLWQKLWNREHQPKPPGDETPEHKKQRRAAARKQKRNRPFEEKESYRWVEAMNTLDKEVASSTRVIHVFDREGDIAEVFAQLKELTHTGVVVRASHNRALDEGINQDTDTSHLWLKLEAQSIQGYHNVELSQTKTRQARRVKLAVRFCPVQLSSPKRLGQAPLEVYAVYAHEVEPPEGEQPVSWMLLTSESIETLEQAITIVRWYSYRWRVEDYHQVLKSGCKAQSYRLAADSMKTLLGFLSVIAVDLLRLTYLKRTEPELPAQSVLTPLQIEVLLAKTKDQVVVPLTLTIAWAVEAIAYLGGYLQHRRKTPIGIEVLWRGWDRLQTLVDGWSLARQT